MPSLDDIDPQKLIMLEMDLTNRTFDDLIEYIRRYYGLASISYMCSAFRGRNPSDPFLTLTYGEALTEHGQGRNSTVLDPVRDVGARSAGPLDWADFRGMEKKVRRLFNDAPDLGSQTQGLTIPVRGPTPGISALFSVTSHDSDAAWSVRRYELMRDMVHVAHFVHQKAHDLYADGSGIDTATFTPREIEALQWAAQGLLPEDIGFAMRISVETVKAYLDSARFKLKALNRSHAVTKAARVGLIR